MGPHGVMEGKASRFSIFSWEKFLAKHESLYEQWVFEVQSLQRTYSKVKIKEAILNSVKGAVVQIVRSLSPEAKVQ